MVPISKCLKFINEINIDINDMAQAEDINDIDLLNNLKNRFFRDEIFTNVGSTLIIVNPYKNIPYLYDENSLNKHFHV